MRVIAGSAKRIQLKTIEGLETRPTTDRIKETLFNVLQYDLYDTVFLDLFSGSGGIGIEALSRGAKEAVFIEQNPQAVQCIKDNLKATKLEHQATVIKGEVLQSLHRLAGTSKVDYVFMDPPYNHNHEKEVLTYLSTANILAEDALIIIEASKETEFDYVESLGFEIAKVKTYKTNKHIFIEAYRGGSVC